MKRVVVLLLLLLVLVFAAVAQEEPQAEISEDPFYHEVKLGEIFPISLKIPNLPEGVKISKGEWTFAYRDTDFTISGWAAPKPNLQYTVPTNLREGWNGVRIIWRNPDQITDEELAEAELTREDLYPFSTESFSVLALKAMRVSSTPIEIPAPDVTLYDENGKEYLVNVKSTKVVVTEKPVIDMELDVVSSDDQTTDNTLP